MPYDLRPHVRANLIRRTTQALITYIKWWRSRAINKARRETLERVRRALGGE
jgi:hypothetical protein